MFRGTIIQSALKALLLCNIFYNIVLTCIISDYYNNGYGILINICAEKKQQKMFEKLFKSQSTMNWLTVLTFVFVAVLIVDSYRQTKLLKFMTPTNTPAPSATPTV